MAEATPRPTSATDSTRAEGAGSGQDSGNRQASAAPPAGAPVAPPGSAETSPPATPPRLQIQTSRQFTGWPAAEQLSLAFTTYQGGKVFFLGLKPDGGLEVFNRTFERCMGLSASSQTLWLSSLYQLWRFENLLEPGQLYQSYDRVYLPQVACNTGHVDIHDGGVSTSGRSVFVNTLFSCLAALIGNRQLSGVLSARPETRTMPPSFTTATGKRWQRATDGRGAVARSGRG